MPASSAEKQAQAEAAAPEANSLKEAYEARQAAKRPLPKSLRRAYEQLIARSEARGSEASYS